MMELKKGFVRQIQGIIATAKELAGYGEFLIKSLSEELQPQFGSGFSVRQLELCRQFYRIFPITNALRSQFSWTHYPPSN
jgi:hypothetical protein